MKICANCNEEKHLTEFRRDSRKEGGFMPACKACRKFQRGRKPPHVNFIKKLKHRYNLTAEDYLLLVESQDGKCAICKEDDELCVDHNHITGKVRGLLCHNCNSGLGLFLEDYTLLEEAIRYIKRDKDETMGASTLP